MTSGLNTDVDSELLPDTTAVLVAIWRGTHLQLDAAPHVFDDEVGIMLANCATALSVLGISSSGELPNGGDWRNLPQFAGPLAGAFRPLMVGRARYVEDLLDALIEAEGLDQYVILGAGLDSLAFRRGDLLVHLQVYEIDQPGPQRWKQERLAELNLTVPQGLRFVPVDFEAGDSWSGRLSDAGFDGRRSALLSALGLTQYITRDATAAIFREAAALAPGSTLVSSFVVPIDLVDPAERHPTETMKDVIAARGCPFVSEYTPAEFVSLAEHAGFEDVRHIEPRELTERYFVGRSDGLQMPSVEHFLVARTG